MGAGANPDTCFLGRHRLGARPGGLGGTHSPPKTRRSERPLRGGKDEPDRQELVRNANRNQSACGSLDGYASILIGAEDFGAVARSDRPPGLDGNTILDEANRTVGESDIHAPRVVAGGWRNARVTTQSGSIHARGVFACEPVALRNRLDCRPFWCRPIRSAPAAAFVWCFSPGLRSLADGHSHQSRGV
jgi:hypothetical protein